MGDLHQDHRNIRELLGLLARELDAVSDASGGDFELMRDIMIYMTRYPDHTHHPKEDLMFERMRERGAAPDTKSTIETLLREHVALAEKGNIFRDMLIGVVDGALVEREALVAAGRDYAEFLGYHARLEDETVFLEAEKLLDDVDWTVVRKAFEAQVDPVFGPAVDLEFESLHDHIRYSAAP
jgi:hemerythrin-like domain-containing protein